MRFNELIAGVRGDIAIKLYGDELEELRRLGGEVVAAFVRPAPGQAFDKEVLTAYLRDNLSPRD